MKTKILLFCISLIGLGALAQQKNNGSNIIEVSSNLTVKGQKTHHYTITLLCDGAELKKYNVTKSLPVFIELESNKVFSLLYSKPGFPDKIVIVNTELPANPRNPKLLFEFTIELDPSHTTQKTEYHDYPVALVHYNKKNQEFSYSQNYFGEVHKPTQITKN
jgi:hypothetical protein